MTRSALASKTVTSDSAGSLSLHRRQTTKPAEFGQFKASGGGAGTFDTFRSRVNLDSEDLDWLPCIVSVF